MLNGACCGFQLVAPQDDHWVSTPVSKQEEMAQVVAFARKFISPWLADTIGAKPGDAHCAVCNAKPLSEKVAFSAVYILFIFLPSGNAGFKGVHWVLQHEVLLYQMVPKLIEAMYFIN